VRRRLILAGLLLGCCVVATWVALGWLRVKDLRRVEAWLPAIEAAAAEAEIDAFLLAGVVYAESRGDAQAVSGAGARGLCQLMPSTAEELALRVDVDGPPYAPEDNLRMGARYLRELLDRFDGDVDLALLGYRMGPTRVAREVREQGRGTFVADLRSSAASPWNYRSQVLESGALLRGRAGR
jgi:soluble lytic murein transglycosylase-like protein